MSFRKLLENKALTCLEIPFFWLYARCGELAHRKTEMAVLAPQYAYKHKAALFCTLGHFGEAEQKSRFHLEVKSKTPASKGPFSDQQKMDNAAGFGRRAAVCLPVLFPYFARTDVERRDSHASYQSPFDTQRPSACWRKASCAGRALKQKAGGNQRKKTK